MATAGSTHSGWLTVGKVAKVLLWLVYAWLAITIVLLFLAFLLQLLGADPSAGFVEFVYRSTQRAMAPFRGMFDSVTLSDESVLDVSILFAIIVYSFVALGINLALDWVTHRLRLREYRESVAAPASPISNPGSPCASSSGRNPTCRRNATTWWVC